ncbi:MAG TPA: sensor histidine kinase [Dehalococcoidia bacterium]|nr:sensor histidine kinase [Dehalococcoidia bacterium]
MTSSATRTQRLIERIRGVNPHALDAVLALSFTAAALWTVAGRVSGDSGAYRDDEALGILLVLLQTVPIVARSVAPLAALTISVVAISLHIGIGYEGVPAGTFAALVILYSVASLTDMRQSILAALIAAAGITIYFTTDRGDLGLPDAISTYATYGVGWALGVYARSRREYTNVVEERASLLEREREVQAREAVADERARIARELHDVVGHALNLIVIQSGGAQRVLESRPEVAQDSLVSIESAGRQALADMERMLGILRATDEASESLSPQPGLRHVDQLAEQVTHAGLPVTITIEGTPAELPPSVDLTGYRIVQEALTNVLKHAGPAHASVMIRHSPTCLELDITDDGQGVSGDADADSDRGGGRGLIGMRERVAVFGGELTAGRLPGGGFRVHARLPLNGGAS